MPSPSSKVRKAQVLTSERRDRDIKSLTMFLKATRLFLVNQIFPPQLTAWVLRDKVTEKGVTDPWSPSHVWQAEGEESKPFQFRELSIILGSCSPVSSGFIPRGVIALTFSQGELGIDGEARNYSTRCLLSNRFYFVLKKEGKKKSNEKVQAEEPFSLLQAPWTFAESSLSLQAVN